jgi:hypothetical protein
MLLPQTFLPPLMHQLLLIQWGFFRIFELEFLVKSYKTILQFATFFQQKDETLKMFYNKLFKLKEDT